jgi:hypothetical protein
MDRSKYYENYPLWIVFISNFLSVAIYAIGAFILYRLEPLLSIFYLMYIILLELRLLKSSCSNCYYYGKTCAFGKGRLSRLLFKKGDPKKFSQREITWKDILPDFMVSLIPMATGVILLIKDFSWMILTLILALGILGFAGNALVRGMLACKYCKQRELGCPAEQLFSKTKK